MVENIKDISLTDYSIQHPAKGQKIELQDSLIDHEDLKGILFLGVRGDIDIDVSDKSKVDFLA